MTQKRVEKALAEGSMLPQKKCKKRVRCEVQEEKVEDTCSKRQRGGDQITYPPEIELMSESIKLKWLIENQYRSCDSQWPFLLCFISQGRKVQNSCYNPLPIKIIINFFFHGITCILELPHILLSEQFWWS
jgi:hypothetical protein